ncbi:MAG: hypothetical protein GWO05_04140 [Gammaproteobacteria bacterium]|nr:hypothetical protein [Gammaproteobacteria bacterium]
MDQNLVEKVTRAFDAAAASVERARARGTLPDDAPSERDVETFATALVITRRRADAS